MKQITSFCEYCPMKNRQVVQVAADDICECTDLPDNFCDIAKSNYDMFQRGEIANLQDFLNKQLEDYDNECERMCEAYEKTIIREKRERAKLNKIYKKIADKYNKKLNDILLEIRECKAKLRVNANARAFCEVFKSNQDLIQMSGAKNDIIDNDKEIESQLQEYRKQYKELLNQKGQEVTEQIKKLLED